MWPYKIIFLQHLEKQLREKEPDLVKFLPSTEEPIQFAENVNKATLVLPSETLGYRIVSDIKVLEVHTAALRRSC